MSWKTTALLLAAMLAPPVVHGQSWTNRYNGIGDYIDIPGSVVLDSDGNAYVTGEAWGTNNNYDLATIAYSSAGTALWTNVYDGPAHGLDYGETVKVGTNGDVYVCGPSRGVGSGLDYVIIAYSHQGAPLWTNRYNGPANGSDAARAMALDAGGNIYVTGESGGNAYDYATIKYSSAGVPLWTNRYSSGLNVNNYAIGVAVGSNGNVYVTGAPDIGTNGITTVAYSSAGVPLWIRQYNGPRNDGYATAIAVGGNGTVFVSGNTSTLGSNDMIAGDYVTLAYSSAGVPLWTNLYSSPGNSRDRSTAVAVGAEGNVYVTGYCEIGGPISTVAYTGAGTPLWTNIYNGEEGLGGTSAAITVRADGTVIVTGSSYGPFNQSQYVTIAYSSAGLPLWTNFYKGISDDFDEARAVAADDKGNVVVTGYSATGIYYDYVTIRYAAPVMLSILTTNSNFGFANGHFGFDVSGPAGSNVVIQASDDLQAWSPVQTNSLGAGLYYFSDPEPTQTGSRFYRAFIPQ